MVASGSLPVGAELPAAEDVEGLLLFPPQPVTSVAMAVTATAPTIRLREPPTGEHTETDRPSRARVERLRTKTPKITRIGT
ncbi:hypothetical protein Airi01_026170 [Actinoallomurus iriomotensis]|uniref:Uncharacterized protein n=1 Tax=Actinoallomurus iriomotensis TaxID=478107 RepID=A0A9W6RI77_9ACTN|nr:hypothetical protein Airi01_026170 [Actinoallomurus iriomotensis]